MNVLSQWRATVWHNCFMATARTCGISRFIAFRKTFFTASFLQNGFQGIGMKSRTQMLQVPRGGTPHPLRYQHAVVFNITQAICESFLTIPFPLWNPACTHKLHEVRECVPLTFHLNVQRLTKSKFVICQKEKKQNCEKPSSASL